MKEKFFENLRVLDTGVLAAEENMRFDEALLDELKESPILHLYRWKRPSLTYGYFIKPEEHLKCDEMGRRGIDAAKRPTGGGIVFHIWDLAFSFLLPSAHPAFSLNPLENYRFVNNIVLEAVKASFGIQQAALSASDFPTAYAACSRFCMAKPTQYDVVWEGRKVAGSAQRKKKQGYLHQGTISLSQPDPELLRALLIYDEVRSAIEEYTFAPVQGEVTEELRSLLEEKLIEKLAAVV